jgi:thiamine-phosphate pyrophosphorylase
MNISQIKVYVIIDINLLRKYDIDPIPVFHEAYRGGARMFQLRHEDALEAELFTEALKFKEISKRLRTLLIVNNSLSVALAADANGVHLGQDDLPIEIAKEIIHRLKLDEFIIGASANTLEEALKAQEDGADYIGFGSVFPTDTKKDTRRTSLNKLREASEKLDIPVFPLGGIDLSNVDKVLQYGVKRVCVASSVITSDNPRKVTKDLLRKVSV